MKLLLRGIGEGITEDDESRRPAELLVVAAMEMGANWARVWGREAGRARELEGRGSRRPVRIRTRGTRIAGTWREDGRWRRVDACGATRGAEQREKEMERLTGGSGEEIFLFLLFFLGL